MLCFVKFGEGAEGGGGLCLTAAFNCNRRYAPSPVRGAVVERAKVPSSGVAAATRIAAPGLTRCTPVSVSKKRKARAEATASACADAKRDAAAWMRCRLKGSEVTHQAKLLGNCVRMEGRRLYAQT